MATNFSERLQTRVTIKKVDFRFFNQLILEGVMIEDRKKDTLLYAGSVKGDVTDWFIFKDKISIKNAVISNAIVNMNRVDSVWNYQFIMDFFASPKKSSGNKKIIDIDVKEAHLTNIRFNKIDQWIGQNLTASFKRLDVTVDSVNFNTGNYAVNELLLEQPVFSQSDYIGRKPAQQKNLTDVMAQIPIVSSFKWNNSGILMRIRNVIVHDGRFINDKFTDRPAYDKQFDGQHVDFAAINGHFGNILFLRDTLTADISLSSKERSGLELKKFKSNLKFTPELMEFKNLELVSNKSSLGNYFSMQYKNFGEDFSSFIHNVSLDADFKNSVLSSDDLGIFAPQLLTWKRKFVFEGNAKGTIDNFTARNMKIKTGASYVDGDLSMRGLPDINSTFIDFKSNVLRTNYAEMVAIAPGLRKVTKPAINKLGQVAFAGTFTGFINDFVSYGTFKTALGNLVTDVNMKTPAGREPSYSGKISSNGFNVGAFLDSKDLGNVALSASISGQSFNINKLRAKVDADIKNIDFNGYDYQNLKINGDFEKKLFVGHLSIDDRNLKISGLDGALNLAEKEISFNLIANVEKANLRNIKLVNQNLSFSGMFSLNFTGSTIDDFLGTARVYNASLQNDSTRLSFDSLTLTSQLIGSDKQLSLQSNEIDASILGRFKIMELPDAFKIFLGRYYPTYIELPKRRVDNQDFSFHIKTNNADQYIKLLDPKLGGFNNSTINGSLRMDSSALVIDARVPEFSYDGKIFTNTILNGNGNRDTLVTEIAVEDIYFNDSLHFPNSKLRVSAHNDVSFINLNTRASKTLNETELNASVQTLKDGVKIHFFPSSFVLNDKKWQLEKDGELTIRRNYIDANEVKFAHEDEQIVLSTELDEVTDNTHLVAKLKNVIIEDFLPFFVTKPSLKGILTGTAVARDPFGKTVIEFEGTTDSFRLEDRYIGKINMSANANTNTGLIKFKTSSEEQKYGFNIDGSYNYKDSSENQMDINFLADRFNLDVLEPFLGSIFSEMRGVANGNLKIYGGAGKQYIVGDATISGGSVKVAYTRCRYLFDNQKISFQKDVLDIGTIQLKDTLNNTGTVQGKMYHHFFQDLSFEGMRFETSKLLLLNTQKKDNPNFYGNVIGKAVMTMNGPVSNLQMNIDGEPSATDSSHIYLPTGASRESNVVDYIDFIQFGSEMDADTRSDKSTNLVLNMNLTANPACKIDVILDEETGDIIKGQGNGKLNIRVGNREPLKMSGRYDITHGEYTFNFQTFLKKPFTLNQGSITWNGDPFEAIIDLDAEYLAKNVDISSLSNPIRNSLSTSTRPVQKSDVTILSRLTGSLKKPVITFEFRLPDNSPYNRDYLIVKKLADFKNDENQMLNQVASLLLFNAFFTEEQSFLTGQNTFALATNTIGGVISGWLTNTFNKELERATKGVITTYIDINPTVDLQTTASQLQANIRGGLKILLSSRLNVLVGGNIDYNNPYASQLNRKTLFTPDITVEWLLNPDGSIRVVGFNRTSIDITSGQRNRSGIQLSYRKDINKLSEIFMSNKKLRKKEEDARPKVKVQP